MDHHRRGTRGWGGLEPNHIFCTGQGHCSHELTTAVVARTGPAQHQAGQRSGTEQEGVVSPTSG